jgi:aldose 1-epimerase
LNADKYTITDEDSIPTGKLGCVGGTVFDLRVPREMGPAMAMTKRRGYDDNFCVTKGTDQKLAFVGRVLHPASGRWLEVYSDQIGVQFYTSNAMPDPDGTVGYVILFFERAILYF